ncbi:MAG: hypothetical protein V4664_02375 [Patescibacteria group bacterium]
MKIVDFRPEDYTVFGCNPHRGVSPAGVIQRIQGGISGNTEVIGKYPVSDRTSGIIHAIFVELYGKPSFPNLKVELDSSICNPDWFLPDACEVASFIAFNARAFPNDFPARLICGIDPTNSATMLVLERTGWDSMAKYTLTEVPSSSATDEHFIMLASETYEP